MGDQESRVLPSDENLIGRAQAGDARAFGELWRRHSASATRVARRFTTIDADDLVSEAYTRIYQRVLAGGGPSGAFRPYLYTTVRNLAASWGRGERDVPVDDLDELGDERIAADPASIALDRTLTVRAFRSLPERWQSVLWYTEVEGMDPHEVAPILGLTANGVAALSYRAREGLRAAWLQAHVSAAGTAPECRWVLDRLGTRARRALPSREEGRVLAHLGECAKCTIVSEEVEEVGSRLAFVMLPLMLGGAVGGALLSQLGAAGTALAAPAVGSVGAAAGAGSGGILPGGLAAQGVAGAATGAGGAAAGTAAGTGGAVAATASGGMAVVAGATSVAPGAVAAGAAAGGAVSAGTAGAVGTALAGSGAAAGAGLLSASGIGAAAGGVALIAAIGGAVVLGGTAPVDPAGSVAPQSSAVAEASEADAGTGTGTAGDRPLAGGAGVDSGSGPGPADIPVIGGSSSGAAEGSAGSDGGLSDTGPSTVPGTPSTADPGSTGPIDVPTVPPVAAPPVPPAVPPVASGPPATVDVALSGRGTPGATVSAHSSGGPWTSTTVAADGRWALSLEARTGASDRIKVKQRGSGLVGPLATPLSVDAPGPVGFAVDLLP